MKINYNLSAYVANAHLLQNEDRLTKSLERLSSGYKLNHASDDPAGVAIAAKMRTQIRGLERASQNSSDGISVLETAEGALQEVTSILQRMRELAVQAGNDTYAEEDREAMQKEIDALKEEINRVSTDTEFNKMTLLDGSLSSRVYANTRDVSLVEVSEEVAVGNYSMTLEGDAAHAVLAAQPADLSNYEDANGVVQIPEGKISINGVVITFKGNETQEEVYTMIRDAAERGEVNVMATDMDITIDRTAAEIAANPQTEGYVVANDGFSFGDALVFVSRDTGSNEKVEIKFSDNNIAGFFGMTVDQNAAYGKDARISLDTDDFSKQATVLADGESVTITDRQGFKMKFDIRVGSYAQELADAQAADPAVTSVQKDIMLEVTDIGNMDLQVGANQFQTITIDIPCMSSAALRIDKVDVTTVFGTDKALIALDAAIARVSEVRSNMGAAENRLNYAVDSLSETTLNMNSALSRIEDVDMATEMSTYTQMNVLTQAATSVLAQANDIPQQTLQLLQ